MIKYKEYLTGEEPEKKKEQSAVGATTPTTSPVLTYEGFVGTGTAPNAEQQGVNYAQGIKDSIYGSAEALRKQTDIDIENARQRGIIDSQSSYQKAIGTYGANAEALGGMGLTGAGYGEYLTANAYATHRGQVQDINAQAMKANREAASLEAQTKETAYANYLQNLKAEEESNKQTAAGLYGEWLSGIKNGEISPSELKANPYYELLDDNMKTEINNAFVSKGANYLTSLSEENDATYSAFDAEKALKMAGYSDNDIPGILDIWRENNYKEYVNSTDLTDDDISKAETAGVITAEHAQKLREKIADKMSEKLNKLYPSAEDGYEVKISGRINGTYVKKDGKWYLKPDSEV